MVGARGSASACGLSNAQASLPSPRTAARRGGFGRQLVFSRERASPELFDEYYYLHVEEILPSRHRQARRVLAASCPSCLVTVQRLVGWFGCGLAPQQVLDWSAGGDLSAAALKKTVRKLSCWCFSPGFAMQASCTVGAAGTRGEIAWMTVAPLR